MFKNYLVRKFFFLLAIFLKALQVPPKLGNFPHISSDSVKLDEIWQYIKKYICKSMETVHIGWALKL
jgi:hypothetical protein